MYSVGNRDTNIVADKAVISSNFLFFIGNILPMFSQNNWYDLLSKHHGSLSIRTVDISI